MSELEVKSLFRSPYAYQTTAIETAQKAEDIEASHQWNLMRNPFSGRIAIAATELRRHGKYGGIEMARVIGLGGLFLHCENTENTKAWYKTVMGVDMNDFGGWDFIHAEAGKAFPNGARTIFAAFDKPDYFKPSTLPFMLNLMVDDLDGVLARCAEAGIEEVGERQSYEYGHFAWLMDPDGRKVELWQPIEPQS